MKKIVVASVIIVLLLVLPLAVAQPWITWPTPVNRIPSSYEIGYTEIKQTFLEGQAPSHPPGGYVKLRGYDVNPYVPDDCKLIFCDATLSNSRDDVARCDFIGRVSGGSAVFRNQALFITDMQPGFARWPYPTSHPPYLSDPDVPGDIPDFIFITELPPGVVAVP